MENKSLSRIFSKCSIPVTHVYLFLVDSNTVHGSKFIEIVVEMMK